MSFADLAVDGGSLLPVLTMRGTLVIKGAWYFELELDATASEAPHVLDRATLLVAGRSFRGYVARAREWHGRTRLFLEAGAYGMRAVVDALQYESALVSTIARQIVESAGEVVSSTAEAPTEVLAYYHRAQQAGGVALSSVLSTIGLTWRFTDAGDVWWGVDTWESASEVDMLEVEPFGGTATTTIRLDAPTLSPGYTFGGRPIERVVYTLSEEESLTALLTFTRDGGGDLRGAFGRAVRAVVPELPLLPRYPATVVRQGADGRLELAPDDTPTVAGSPPVPPLYGLPGVRCEVAAGARVGLAHDAGDARRPCAMGWEQQTPATLIEIEAQQIRLGKDATRGVIRLNDIGVAGTWIAAGPSLTHVGADGETVWSLQGTADTTTGIVTWAIVPVNGDAGIQFTKAVRGSNIVRAV